MGNDTAASYFSGEVYRPDKAEAVEAGSPVTTEELKRFSQLNDPIQQLAIIYRAEQRAAEKNMATLTKWLFATGAAIFAAIVGSDWLGVGVAEWLATNLANWIFPVALFLFSCVLLVLLVAHYDEKRAEKANLRAKAYKEVFAIRVSNTAGGNPTHVDGDHERKPLPNSARAPHA